MGHQGTILVIDDDPDTVAMLAKLLGARGWDVVSANNGEEGLRLAKRHVPDLVVLDFEMPGMDGKSVYGSVRAMPEGRWPGFIFISGSARRRELKPIVAADPRTRFILKPLRLLEVVHCAERLLRGRHPGLIPEPEDPFEAR